MKASGSDLKDFIEVAFGHSDPPSPSRLVNGDRLEVQQVRDFFAAKTWQQITLSSLQNDYVGDGSACLWFMTPEAVAYYFPSYLLLSCFEYYEADAISSEFVFKLARVASGEVNNISVGLEQMTAAQNTAIARALLYIDTEFESKHPDSNARTALDSRWQKYFNGHAGQNAQQSAAATKAANDIAKYCKGPSICDPKTKN